MGKEETQNMGDIRQTIKRKKWNMILGALDILMMIAAAYLALLTRFEFYPSKVALVFLKSVFQYMPLNLFCSILIFMAYKLYSTQWKYAGISDFVNVIKSVFISSVFQLIGISMLRWEIPRSYFFLYLVYLMLGTFFIRLLVRLIQGKEPLRIKDTNKKKVSVMLIGAGEAGNIILNEIKKSAYVNKSIKCIIDDNPAKKHTYLSGVPVVGNRHTIIRNAIKYDIEEIILAIPTLSAKDRKEILEICKQTGCHLSILPGLYQLINSEVTVSSLREVEIEDLLGREPVKANLPSIMNYVKDQIVFVTGGGGSIGSEICRQVARYKPKKLVIIDNYENNAYEIQMELKRKHPELDLKVLILSVQNHLRMHNIFQDYKPDIVFHAAAHKHVPLMEDSPHDAIKNNVFGIFNVAKEAGLSGVKRMVLISTDKAVRPTNIMGASKRVCEMVIQYMNTQYDTEYVAVRFGNVLGSNGSVVPLFKKQIANGGPVTVTHPEIIRYFMTIPEAVSLVLEAGAYAKGGEIFILDMGEPVRILDLAENMIRLSGLIPGEDIEIQFTGLRPGEKLYEELLIDEENKKETENKRIFIGNPKMMPPEQFGKLIAELDHAAFSEDPRIREVVKKLVPEYTYQQTK